MPISAFPFSIAPSGTHDPNPKRVLGIGTDNMINAVNSANDVLFARYIMVPTIDSNPRTPLIENTAYFNTTINGVGVVPISLQPAGPGGVGPLQPLESANVVPVSHHPGGTGGVAPAPLQPAGTQGAVPVSIQHAGTGDVVPVPPQSGTTTTETAAPNTVPPLWRSNATGNNGEGDNLKGYTNTWFSQVRFPAIEIECVSPTAELIRMTQLCWRSGSNLIPVQCQGKLISSVNEVKRSRSKKSTKNKQKCDVQGHGKAISSITKVKQKCPRHKQKCDVQQTTSLPFSDAMFQNSGDVNTIAASQTSTGTPCSVTIIVPKPCKELQSDDVLLSSRGVDVKDASNDVDVLKPDSVKDSAVVPGAVPYSETTVEGIQHTEDKTVDGVLSEKEEPISHDDGEIRRKEEPNSDDGDYEIVQNVESSDEEEDMEDRWGIVKDESTLYSSSTISPSAADGEDMVEEEEWMSDDGVNHDVVQQYLGVTKQPQDIFVSSSAPSGHQRNLTICAAMDLKLEGEDMVQAHSKHNVIVAVDHHGKDGDFEMSDSDIGYGGKGTKKIPGRPRLKHLDGKYKLDKSAKQHKHLCSICGAMVNDLNSHIKRVHEDMKKYRCSQCEYGCNSKPALDAHIASKHDPSKLAVCEYCGKRFTRHRYVTHVKLVHCKTKDYSCKVCGKKFASTHYVNCHVKRVHRDSSNYVSCSVCNKKIKDVKNGWNLKMHMAIHSGDRHYNCHLCDYKCIQLNALNWHMKSRHLISKKNKNSDHQ